jgi:hypothetical protein
VSVVVVFFSLPSLSLAIDLCKILEPKSRGYGKMQKEAASYGDIWRQEMEKAHQAEEIFTREAKILIPLIKDTAGGGLTKTNAINRLIELFGRRGYQFNLPAQFTFTENIGYSIPTTVEVTQIKTWIEEYANDADTRAGRLVKFVDMGAGSGVLEYLLCEAGVARDRLVAIDRREESQFTVEHWPMVRNGEYKVDPSDIFFVAWGHRESTLGRLLKDYVERGGQCAIIWGEYQGGCCRPTPEYFEVVHSETWSTVSIAATYMPAGAVDVISFNRRTNM